MKIRDIKIVFLGTPEFAAVILQELVGAGFRPVLVISGPDKPVGRKQTITPPPVKLLAQKYNLNIIQPAEIRSSKQEIRDQQPDLILVAAYGQILPKEILGLPKYGCLNVHPSLLPSWRGPSPIQYTILNGDSETGVTIMIMDEIIDHGGILTSAKFKIANEKITCQELTKQLAELGARLLIETIPAWLKGKIKPQPQNDAKATYTKILRKDDGRINWNKPAEYIERQIRAFSPWPGVFAFFKDKNLKILTAHILKQTEIGPFGKAGKTFLAPDDKIAVQCGKDFLVIEELQLGGGKRMTAKDFLRGHSDFIGVILK